IVGGTGPATAALYHLSLHDALPIWAFEIPAFEELREELLGKVVGVVGAVAEVADVGADGGTVESADLGEGALAVLGGPARDPGRSEEHTSELQSRENPVCRLLLEKK